MNINRLPVIKGRTGLSTPTIYRLMAEGKFPKQIKLGARSVGWLESDIDEWLDARIAESKEGRAV